MGIKASRNDKCLCGSMKKYKHCCLPKGINYDKMSDSEMARNMNIHGKNMLFIYKLLDVLEIDSFVDKGKTTEALIIHIKKVLNPQKIRNLELDQGLKGILLLINSYFIKHQRIPKG